MSSVSARRVSPRDSASRTSPSSSCVPVHAFMRRRAGEETYSLMRHRPRIGSRSRRIHGDRRTGGVMAVQIFRKCFETVWRARADPAVTPFARRAAAAIRLLIRERSWLARTTALSLGAELRVRGADDQHVAVPDRDRDEGLPL